MTKAEEMCANKLLLVGKEARNSSARQKAKREITKTTFDTTEKHPDDTCLVVFYNQAISVRVLLFTCN